jgi:hypothetical protein
LGVAIWSIGNENNFLDKGTSGSFFVIDLTQSRKDAEAQRGSEWGQEEEGMQTLT